MIPFNKPYLTGRELKYLEKVVKGKHFSGNGEFTKKCSAFFTKQFNLKNNFITTSCTDALEMAAILTGIKPGDEIILPSYTFVSTANAFLLRGAKLVFCDSKPNHPNIDENKIEELITKKTKAVVVVHYAGMACEMGKISKICKSNKLILIEDAAQGVNSFYKKEVLGSIGTFGAYSFHETKNIQCGEGGLFIVNDKNYITEAETIWEKGTNRSEFLKGKVQQYGWKNIGSSFYPSELTSAFLLAQLEESKKITAKRIERWNQYQAILSENTSKAFSLPKIESYMNHNAHHFFILAKNLNGRTKILNQLSTKNIKATFHYSPLHKSEYFLKYNKLKKLTNAETFGETLIRLPLYNEISKKEIDFVAEQLIKL